MEEKIDQRAQMMGTAKVPSAIVRLAIPAIISMAVMAIYNMADTYFVSISPEGYLGTAAVSVFMPIMLTTQALSILFAAGGAAYLSRLLGAGEPEKAGKTATTTITLSFLAGVLVAAVVGYACIRLLKMIAEKGRFGFFAYYCWLAGAVTLALTLLQK